MRSQDRRPEIVVSAVVLRDESGALLAVRKRGTTRFMFPGGTIEPGENPGDAAVRECAEELGVRLDADALRLVGDFRTAAANEPGCDLVATVDEHPWVDGVRAAAEIAELRSLGAGDPVPPDAAPLLAAVVEHLRAGG